MKAVNRTGQRVVLVLTVWLYGLNLHAAPRELVVYTWPEYFDASLIIEFEKQYDAKVREIWYESDEGKDAAFFLHYRDKVDVMVSSGTTLPPYLELKALAPLAKPVDEGRLEPLLKTFTWGTLGIAYRSDLTTVDFNSWMDLFRPSKALHGQIVMLSDVQDLTELAAIALNKSPQSPSDEDLAAAHELLASQKSAVASYDYMDPYERADLVTGKVSVALQYNGDAIYISDFNPAIKFSVPREGTLLWVDYMVVNAQAPNPDLAQAFVEFFSQAEVSAANTKVMYYASPWLDAKAMVPDEIRNNPAIYPDVDAAENLHVSPPLSSQQKKKYNALLENILR